jgi:hypothetical protein
MRGRRAVVLALVLGATACAYFSQPKPPPTVTFDKAAITQIVIRLDQVYLQLHAVVEGDCATLKRLKPATHSLVADDCATLREIKDAWTTAVTDTLLSIAAAPEGRTVNVEKLTEFLVKLAVLAAKLAVLV